MALGNQPAFSSQDRKYMGEYQVRKQGQTEILGQGTQGCVPNDA